MRVKLKPCPHCGSKYLEIIMPVEKGYQVQCGDCYASGSVEDTKPKAVKAWNRRVVIETCFGVPVDRLRELAAAYTNGQAVIMPCNIGDTVYAINQNSKQVIPCYVSYMEIDGGLYIHVFFETSDVCEDEFKCNGCPFYSWSQNTPDEDWSCGGEYGEFDFQQDDFGKIVFRSPDKAEAALKGGAE